MCERKHMRSVATFGAEFYIVIVEKINVTVLLLNDPYSAKKQ